MQGGSRLLRGCTCISASIQDCKEIPTAKHIFAMMPESIEQYKLLYDLHLQTFCMVLTTARSPSTTVNPSRSGVAVTKRSLAQANVERASPSNTIYRQQQLYERVYGRSSVSQVTK
jgi:hypothetical protein